jgi:GxxExxY protein
MDADERRLELDRLTEKIISCCYQVANTLGAGFLEKVYENALAHELKKAGLEIGQQFPIAVAYDGEVVGEYVADLIVAKCVLIELKAVKALEDIHAAQCMNYLKATGLKVCLPVNFGKPRIDIRRFVNNY